MTRHATEGPIERTWWSALIGTWLVLGALVSLQVLLSASAIGPGFSAPGFLAARLVEELVVGALVFPALALVRRVPMVRRIGPVRGSGVAFVVLTPLVLAAVPIGIRLDELVLGRGFLFVGSMHAKAITELVSLAVALVVAAMIELQGDVRARESRALQLEATLSEARLEALASQLHPHFLFNTLTAISVLVQRDPAGAATMLSRLSELLRATLRRGSSHRIPLREELALADHYIGIMRVRFGPRLGVEVDAPAGLLDTLVPSFVLQPLIENALEHGIARRAGPGHVTIAAAAVGETLRLTVTDDGPGPVTNAAHGESGGIGLSNTRLRLTQLYGAAATLSLEPRVSGGARVVVELPLQRSDARA